MRARRGIGPLLVVAALAACSGGSDGPAATTSTRDPGKVVDGGTLRLGLGGPLQPDPAAANLGSPSDMLVLDLLHDGLTRLGDDGAAVPALATEWTPDSTLKTWVFKLDPQATFASGRGVTSADVVASLERVAKGGDTSLAALRLETISGFRAFVDGSAPHLAGLSAPDPGTVQIALDTPMSVLPILLASPVFGIVDVASLDAAVASGGRLAGLDLDGSWTVRSAKGDVVTLERRKGAAGHLDAVQVRSYADSAAAYDALDRGRADWALVPVERYGDAVKRHGKAAFRPFHAELFFGMHVSSPNLAKLELRKAIAAAIDREAIVRAVYPDLAVPLSTVIPAGVAGHDDGRCSSCGYDPVGAKAIVAAAYPDGQVPSVAIDFDQSPAQEEMAGIVAHDLTAVGIPSTLRPKPLDEYKRFVVSGGQELFSFGWIGGYGSPDAYLAPLFGSAANDNLTAYASANVDAGLAAARANADPAAALRQWGEVEAQVLADAVVVPIAQFRT
ncbi:MAG: ABC transporter substrate-binding protein, partial [Acidimicrobiales bacterium]